MIKSIKILGHTYKVSHKNMSLSETTAGQCNIATLEINICNAHPQSRQKEAILHEVVEALNYHLELQLPHNQISSLSEGLYSVLVDNPGLLK